MQINLTSLGYAKAGIYKIHKVPIVRRLTASLVGSLVALTGFSIYQDASAMVTAMLHNQNVVHSAPSNHQDATARVKAFAETLKKQRADNVR